MGSSNSDSLTFFSYDHMMHVKNMVQESLLMLTDGILCVRFLLSSETRDALPHYFAWMFFSMEKWLISYC